MTLQTALIFSSSEVLLQQTQMPAGMHPSWLPATALQSFQLVSPTNPHLHPESE